MIEHMYLHNWKSHHETELTFERGVNALIGEMGSGKSSVLEALVFGLFGTTPGLQQRSVKLAQLIRRYPQPADSASVSVTFIVDDVRYTVTRKITRKGSEAELRKDGQLVEGPSATKVTELVEDILQMHFDTFTRAVYAEQNTIPYLLHLTPAERKRTIDGLLQLDVFETVRKHAVTLRNSIQKTRKEKEKEVAQYDTSALQSELTELTNAIEEIQTTLHSQQEEEQRQSREKEQLEEKYNTLAGQKHQYEQLVEKQNTLTGRIESLTNIIAEEDSGEDAETIQEKKDAIAEQIYSIEQAQQDYQRLDAEISQIVQRMTQLEQEITELQERAQQYTHYKSIAERLQEKENEYERIKASLEQSKSRLQSLQDEKHTLSQAEGVCPVCHESLSSEQQEQLLTEKENAIAECEQQQEQHQKQLSALRQKISQLRTQRDKLLQYAQAHQQLKEKQEEEQQYQSQLSEKRQKLESLSQHIDKKQLQNLRAEQSRLERMQQVLQRKSEKQQLESELQNVQTQLHHLSFSYASYEETYKQLQQAQQAVSMLKKEMQHQQELLQEKRQRKQNVEQQLSAVQQLQQTVDRHRQKADFVQHFCEKLEVVQHRLRTEFLESLNTLLESLWEDLYPYRDYTSVRMRSTDDYIMEVKNREGQWVPVAGQISGGERQTAALVFRIALAVLLSPSLQIFILDEPTHNLDEHGIAQLNAHLRETVDSYVDQLFVITHEPRLESSVTGALYRLRKKETQHGLTEVEHVPMT